MLMRERRLTQRDVNWSLQCVTIDSGNMPKYRPGIYKSRQRLPHNSQSLMSWNDNFVVGLKDNILTVFLPLHDCVIVVLKLDLFPILVAQNIDFFWLREGP